MQNKQLEQEIFKVLPKEYDRVVLNSFEDGFNCGVSGVIASLPELMEVLREHIEKSTSPRLDKFGNEMVEIDAILYLLK